MDDLDDVIGLLNSNRQNKAKAASFIPAPKNDLNVKQQSTEEQKEISDRKLNIERMMEELEAMKAKKQELLERNNRLKENQDRPMRDYSNSVPR